MQRERERERIFLAHPGNAFNPAEHNSVYTHLDEGFIIIIICVGGACYYIHILDSRGSMVRRRNGTHIAGRCRVKNTACRSCRPRPALARSPPLFPRRSPFFSSSGFPLDGAACLRERVLLLFFRTDFAETCVCAVRRIDSLLH